LIERMLLDGDLDPLAARAIERLLGSKDRIWEDEIEFCSAVLKQATLDIEEAKRGLGASPLKHRLEALRDQREALRAAVDAPGMSSEGHREFFDVIPALANRTAVGPQRERLEELLSLIDSGLVRLAPGPNPAVTREGGGWDVRSTALRQESRVRVDIVIKAHLDFPELDVEVDPLSAALREWVLPHEGDPRYLSLDRSGRPLVSDGSMCSAVAVFGPPAEGANYYNNYILWPGVWSRLLTDIDLAITPLLSPATRALAAEVDD
jgi:hypothetical protein